MRYAGPMKISIEPATVKDIDELFRLSCKVHRQAPYDALIPPSEQKRYREKFSPGSAFETSFKEKLTRFIKEDNHYAFVARVDESIAGYCTDERRGKDIVIHALFVDSEFRGRGIGKSLIGSSLTRVADGGSAHLTVLAENLPARNLYQSLGFEVTNEPKKDFYGAAQIGMKWRKKH